MPYNHKKGWFWKNDKSKIILLSIPKNASTTLRSAFKPCEMQEDYFNFNKGNFTTVVVLREPLDRLVSGYFEVLKRATEDSPKTLNKAFYYIKDPVKRFYAFIDELHVDMWDAHIAPNLLYNE